MSFTECPTPDCGAKLYGLPDAPAEVYAAMRRHGWHPETNTCPQHSPAADAVYDRMSEDHRRAAVGYLLEQGRHLESLPEWTSGDNQVTTDSLMEAYKAFVAPHEAGDRHCTCGNSRHPEAVDTTVEESGGDGTDYHDVEAGL